MNQIKPKYEEKINVSTIIEQYSNSKTQNIAKIDSRLINYICLNSIEVSNEFKDIYMLYDDVDEIYKERYFLHKTDIFIKYITQELNDNSSMVINIELSSFQTPTKKIKKQLEGIIKGTIE